MQFATPKQINRIWKLFKKLLSASEKKIAALEKLIQTDDIGEYLLTVTDSESHIVMSLDKKGRAQLPKGSLGLKDTLIEESDEPGLFHLIDSEDRILLSVDEDGNTDFKGIPSDIKARLESIEERLEALEN